jgi:SAM-dependent methyltransferase
MPGSHLKVRGWVASMAPIRQIATSRAARIELSREERPDVSAAHPDYPYVTGFKGLIPPNAMDGDTLTLVCSSEEGEAGISNEIREAQPAADKRARLERIRPFLRRDLPCRETSFHFDFLTPEIRARCHVEDTENVSEFAYAPMVRELIDACAGGLALDCGAGRRSGCLPNVINLEIVPYPSTDVLATNEQLPFQDNTFDLVISCAVLEHVRYPFEAAREITRVTKPGGLIYADVPFLQPYHGYPSHYYNMTHQGLANLFSESCEIEKSFVPRYGLPIWSLTWFLNSYLAGLPSEERERFASMRVSDLIGNTMEYLDQPFVKELSDAKNLELASVTSVLARKNAKLEKQTTGSFFSIFRRK